MNPSNFRQPKPRLRRGSMDGIITPASFKREGSINHQVKKHDDEDKTNKLDNFDRADGYHPASKVMEGTESRTPTVIQTPVELPTGPRRRGKDHTNIHSPNQLKSKNHRPWKVVYSETFQNRSGACKRELEIKSYKGGILFKKLLGLWKE